MDTLEFNRIIELYEFLSFFLKMSIRSIVPLFTRDRALLVRSILQAILARNIPANISPLDPSKNILIDSRRKK